MMAGVVLVSRVVVFGDGAVLVLYRVVVVG